MEPRRDSLSALRRPPVVREILVERHGFRGPRRFAPRPVCYGYGYRPALTRPAPHGSGAALPLSCVSLRSWSRTSQCTVPRARTVYRHFTSKVALLDAVVGRWQRDVEANLIRIVEAPDPADDKIEHLLTALANLQREASLHEPNLFAAHLNATMRARRVAKRHRVRLRSLVEHVVEEGMTAGTFVIRDRERAIAFVFDASYRFTHPLAIEQDADLPRDLVNARLAAVIRTIQEALRTGTL